MRLASLATVALLALACAGASPTQTRYLLGSTTMGNNGRVDAPHRVVLGRVSVAPYLDQIGIVVETDAGQVRAARLHRWAEPLQAGIRSSVRAEVSAALGYNVSPSRVDGIDWDYVVDLNVERLHGTMQGTAVIDASYLISRPRAKAEIIEYRFHATLPLPRAGYPGVVDAEAALLRELSRSIAAALRELSVRQAIDESQESRVYRATSLAMKTRALHLAGADPPSTSDSGSPTEPGGGLMPR